MDNYNAPQWVDFNSTLSSESYFDVEHEVCNSELLTPLSKQQNIEESLVEETSFDDSLENIKEDKKSLKSNLYCAWNISISCLASTSGAKSVPQRLKTAAKKNEIKKNTCVKETKNNVVVCKPQQKAQRRQSNSFKSKQQPRKVLTCQYGRRSLIKYRRQSGKFVSTAEAISKFQNDTPERFRTTSKKKQLGPLIKSKQPPLKLTFPVSPKLRCKQRARRTNVLSQEEREALEVEEMKKSCIKANPVPINILKEPPSLKKVPNKRTTVPKEFNLTHLKKTRQTTAPALPELSEDCDNKQILKNTVPTTSSSSSISSVCENDKIQTAKNMRAASRSISAALAVRKDSKEQNKNVKPMSRSISASDVKKDSKEQNNDNVKPTSCSTSASPVRKQETIKPKSSANSAKESTTKKRTVISRPFSFAERDKQLAKKKEEFVKQMQESSRKVPAFHANPAPAFKSVRIHGVVKGKCLNEKSTDKRAKERNESR